jgi:hypothetical protein
MKSLSRARWAELIQPPADFCRGTIMQSPEIWPETDTVHFAELRPNLLFAGREGSAIFGCSRLSSNLRESEKSVRRRIRGAILGAALWALSASPAVAGPVGSVEWKNATFSVELLTSAGDLHTFKLTTDFTGFVDGQAGQPGVDQEGTSLFSLGSTSSPATVTSPASTVHPRPMQRGTLPTVSTLT